MNVAMKWEEIENTSYLRCNRIILARIWQENKNWQLAITVPLGHEKPETHLFAVKDDAKECARRVVQSWFDQIDG